MSWFGRGREREIHSGAAARDLARKIAADGSGAVVIDVRYPPLNFLQSIHRSWREIRVVVNGQAEAFFLPYGVRTEPVAIEVAAGPTSVVVTNMNHERFKLDFELTAGTVQTVIVYPKVTRLSFGYRDEELALGQRFRVRDTSE